MKSATADTAPPISADWQAWGVYLFNLHNNVDRPYDEVHSLLVKTGIRHVTSYYHDGLPGKDFGRLFCAVAS